MKGFRQAKGGRMARESTTMTRGAAKQRLDYDIIDTGEQSRGWLFRIVMTVFFIGATFAMFVIKWDGEVLEPPRPEDEGFDEMELKMKNEDVADKYFAMLNEQREGMDRDRLKAEDKIQRKQRIKEEKKKAKQAFEEHEQKVAKGECDADCKKNHQAITVMHNQISSVVETDYYEVLNIKKKMSKKEMRKNYNDLKKKIEDGDESVKGMDLQEINEAYGVLMNNEARMYYNLYGSRPPAFMKHNSQFARHGGWGQEFQTQAWKVKKLLAWLNFFDSKYADLSVLGIIVLFSAIPIVLNLRELLGKLKEVYPELQYNYEEHAEKMDRLRDEGAKKASQRPGRR